MSDEGQVKTRRQTTEDRGQTGWASRVPRPASVICRLSSVVCRLSSVVWLLAAGGCSEEQGSGLGKDFSYDLAEFRKVDPSLVRYAEAGKIEPGLKEPRGLAVDANDRIYVAGDQAVAVFGPDPTPLPLREGVGGGSGRGAGPGANPRPLAPAGAGDLSLKGRGVIQVGAPPRCLAVAADGTLYVGMKDHIEVFAPTGERRAAWPSLGEKAVLTSVAVSDENVFAADAGNRAVVRYDLSGNVLGLIGKRDEARNIPGFVIPSPHFDLALGRDGLLWVTNPGRHRLQAFTVDRGDLEASWGKAAVGIEGFSGCCNPTDFAFLPDGSFVTSEKGIPRVKVYSHEGKLEAVVAPPDAFDKDVVGLDLATDSKGRVLVLDPAAKCVRVFVKKGTTEKNP